MRRRLKNQRGYSLIEIMFVMALLALFGITTFTLVSVGSDSFSRLLDARSDNSDLRVAMSYITMKVRQYDEVGAISVRRLGEGDALILTDDLGEGYLLETRIYMHEGALYEVLEDADMEFDPLSGFQITTLTGVSLTPLPGNTALRVEVWAGQGEGRVSLVSLVRLRSGLAG